ncbi:MAG TPA: serine/threonine protein kinase [Candidatus Hydrogenedentes bacterium]|nr:serine/threonine protein kinase [Candidatus Hydrogenedentota bacterium]
MSTIEIGGTIADRYVVKCKLGQGGMGAVYLVADAATGQEKALKTLLPKYAQSPHAAVRFVREANTLMRLNHPNIMKIYDARQWEGMLFYVMEYVDGKSLRQWLKERKKLPLNSVVRVLCLVADALNHAHRLTIHRDLAPENIMVLADGSVRLLDFGLAKLDDRYKDLTCVGTNLGRIEYIAPEQQMNAAKVDKRADIYPMGIMFFELLAGRRPKFDEKITDLCPELPPEADEFIRKATASDPNKRFPTAHAFRDELLRVYKIAQGELPSKAAQQQGFMSRMLGRLKGLFAKKAS